MQGWQDPSQGVSPQLLNHLHLISCHRFPFMAQYSPENALDHLLQAPSIVKNQAPMAWQYLQPPPRDGTVFLTWQPPKRGLIFPTDGYIWGDPESSFQVDVRGFKLEILIHRVGCQQGEPIAAHARQRFRIIQCLNPNSQDFDPSLWIVHYAPAEPQSRIESARIPVQPQVQQLLHARRQLESTGTIIRKDFMLHDRHNWPTVQLSNNGPMQAGYGQAGGMYPGGPMQHMVGRQYPQGQAANVAPPAKRQRQVPPQQLPGHAPPAAVGMAHDPLLDDEDTSLGDFFDHLSPRDISSARYIQHHELLEEVFSSPYSIDQIVPVDLGFGLMGELSSLTEGLFEPAKPVKPGQSAPQYQKPDPEHIKTFQTRVDEYLEKGRAEIDKLKAEHAADIADLDRTKSFTQSERRLRHVMWGSEGSRDSQPPETVYHVDLNDDSTTSNKTAEIVDLVEKTLDVNISSQAPIVCVDKGGLIEEDLQQTNGHQDDNGVNGASDGNDSTNGFLDDSAFISDNNTAGGLLDQFGSTSASTPAANQLGSHVSQVTTQPNSSAATPAVGANDRPPTTTQSIGDEAIVSEAPQEQNEPQGDTSLTIDNMDLDVDLGSVAEPNEPKEGDSDWVMVSGEGSHEADATNKSGSDQQQSTEDGPKDDSGIANEPTPASAPPAENTPGMFDPADFANLDDLDTAGDALADLTGGDDDLGLDMDNGSFDDAFPSGDPSGADDQAGAS